MTAGERNVISGNDNSGVYIVNTAATGNKIIGNYLGTNAAGTADLGNATYGVYIDSASNNAIGGTTAGERNVISGNDNSGVYILNTAATGNKISGNYIGTDANGTADLGNTSAGVVINSASNNTIGGTTPSERNIISGNNDVGVFLFSSPTIGNKVIGNYIGTDVTGTLSLGNYVGVSISSAANNFIGGEIPSEGNIISGNNIGVVVSSSNGIGNKILRNSIFNNSNLGIDLGAVGVTANDALDPDIGANNLQNFPVLSCAISTNSSTIIQGTLNSLANTQFRIEFFINDACDASGNGEGQTFFFYANVMTNASGDATINAGITQAIAAGKFITATATRLDASGNPIETSEFSACKAVIAPTLSINDVTVAEGNSGTTNAIFTVTLTGAQGSCLPVTMNYAATGTGGDFNSTGGTLTFNTPISSSAVTQTITVPINGDVTVEANETFPVTLSSVSGATITKATGVGTITNDDSAVVTITDVSVTEGNSGFTSANFQISLSAPVDQLVSVNISAADGTATTANNDYLAPPVTILTFSPGSDHAASGISGRRHEC